MKRLDTAERRARLGVRHRLAVPVATIDQAVDDLVVLHATDPITVYLSARARVTPFEAADLERRLYDDRSLVRVMAMRRTLFVAPVGNVAMLFAACGRSVAEREHRRAVGLIEKAGIAADGHGDGWFRSVRDATVAALCARGEATAAELAGDVAELREQIPQGAGTSWEGTLSVSSMVFSTLSAEARVVRGRPRGSWLSNQHRWVTMTAWVGHEVDGRSPDDARAELARAWLARFGPGTLADLKWWTGWTMGDTRRAVAAVDPVEVALDDGGIGLVLRDDVETTARPEPWVALLPALDPTIMGWTGRDWYIGGRTAAVFDRAGNASPTVWADGRVVGGWALTDDGEVVVGLFEDIGAEAGAAVSAEAASLTSWFSDRTRPRFRTELEREVLAGNIVPRKFPRGV